MIPNPALPEYPSPSSGLKHKTMRAVYLRLRYKKREALTLNDYSGKKYSAEGGRNRVTVLRCFLK